MLSLSSRRILCKHSVRLVSERDLIKNFSRKISITPAQITIVSTSSNSGLLFEKLKLLKVQMRKMSTIADKIKLGHMPERTWNHSMLRIKDKQASLKFYRDLLGLTLLDFYDFHESGFSLLFLATLPPGNNYTLEPGTDKAHKFLWSYPGVCLELTYNHGQEKDKGFKYHVGNEEKDGFGHIALACDDVEKACRKLEEAGCSFKKKPNEGRMKGIAFAYDPDGYWVEIVPREKPPHGVQKESLPYFQLAQTMLRVKDPNISIPFYKDNFDMSLVRESHHSDFSLYFMATLPQGIEAPDPKSSEAKEFVSSQLYSNSIPVLELTHNHGTENDREFSYFNGNEEKRKGFGHIAFLVPDVYEECERLEKTGVSFKKKPDDGSMKGIAFAYDPDGYWVELINRGHEGKFNIK